VPPIWSSCEESCRMPIAPPQRRRPRGQTVMELQMIQDQVGTRSPVSQRELSHRGVKPSGE
jgi:hypothetical protein